MALKKISVNLDRNWVLGHRDGDLLPINLFIETFQKQMPPEIKIGRCGFTECDIIVPDDGLDEEMLLGKVKGILRDTLHVDDLDKNACISIEEYTAEPESVTLPESEVKVPEVIEQNDHGSVQATKRTESSAIEEIRGLIGADDFKILAEKLIKIAPQVNKHATQGIFSSHCYLFSINDGYDSAKYLHLFAQLVSDLNLFPMGNKPQIIQTKLPPSITDQHSGSFDEALSRLHRYGADNAVVYIDICDWMNEVDQIDFRRFLTEVGNCTEHNLVVFRVPFIEEEVLFAIQQQLEDILFIEKIQFIPFSNEQLIEYAKKYLITTGYRMLDDAWEIFSIRIMEEKSDGRFYGVKTVEKVCKEFIYQKQYVIAYDEIEADETCIAKADIVELVRGYKGYKKTGTEMMNDLIGMEDIKQRIEQIIEQILRAKEDKKVESPSIHMRFVGNPGTGKTTVARIFGKLLAERGVLRVGAFFEYSGRDFCGAYVGHTAPKAASMCRDAYGSVLFIDEAYTLYSGDSDSRDYGKEALATLIAEMENHRNDMLVIMAGYPKDMEILMQGNAGLESRMPFMIEFPNYTKEELYKIFIRFAEGRYQYAEGFLDAVHSYFDSLSDEVINSSDFSNARFVRSLFERTWGKALTRQKINQGDGAEIILTKEDLLLAASEREFTKVQYCKQKTLGFI